MNDKISEEYVNAFVDGELAAAERDAALARLNTDEDFKARVCAARALKEQVKAAYADVPLPVSRGAARRTGGIARQALAAGVLLLVGAGVGWQANSRYIASPSLAAPLPLPAGYQPVALAERVDPGKVILHLDSAQPEHVQAVLDMAEQLLAATDRVRAVEIVTNSYGLDLLRAGVSPQPERIRHLVAAHPNLSLVACSQTIARLKREGQEVAMLPEAHIAPSAINQILTRMRDGWVYIKV